MSIYAIADMHLSFGVDKPMNIFGENWEGYEEKIRENWNNEVKETDVVLLPGDFSWATYIEDTKKDFEFLNSLPGKKILLKGNHDYWWGTVKHMKDFIQQNGYENIDFIMNNSVECDEAIIVGTRGWAFNDTENSDKMLARELARLEMSIKDAKLKIEEKPISTEEGKENIEKEQVTRNENEPINQSSKPIICAMHYPPITKTMLQKGEKSKYLELLKRYNIRECVYGHLHGNSHAEAVEGNTGGINLKLVSSDYLGFMPWKIKM